MREGVRERGRGGGSLVWGKRVLYDKMFKCPSLSLSLSSASADV